MQLFEESAFQYEMDTQILTDAIMFGLQGIIHPRFINFAQIKDTASVISKSVTKAAFPIEGEESIISEIMKISDVTILLHCTKLVYYTSLPLIYYSIYQLFQALPLPVRQQMANTSDNFAYIWPTSKYFAINFNKNVYININGESLSKCKKLNNRYICQETEPSRPLNEYAECEVKLSAKIGIRDWSHCEIRLIKLDTTFWARLSTPNSWVFSTKGRDEITINCKPSADVNINIEGLGMLKLPTGV